ncbi:MBL fold metallo-hydrolase [Myxococcota bacterium]|nr:MBL fold metallo-hydrolase [Myxococcota bacterium]
MLELAGVAVEAVSVGGVETCIQLPGLGLCFDMGVCPRRAIRHPLVLFTHAHVDHMAGVVHHCATRHMQGMAPPTYVMPARNAEAFQDMLAVWRRLDGSDLPCRVVPLEAGGSFEIRPGLVATAHPTIHRVVSQGYVLTERRYKLRPELAGLPGPELAARRAAGERLTVEVAGPLVAFTGDSRIEVIERVEDFRRARLLIMEVTFLDERVSVARTREKGHIHLDEVIECAELFQNEAILLTHLSARYGAAEGRRIVQRRLPPSLRDRVTLLVEEREAPERRPAP